MESRLLGGSGLKVPALTFGTGTFGGTNEFFRSWGSSDVAEATRLVDVCLEAGLTMFDSADVYSSGAAEEILGQAIQGRRDRVLISTKGGFRTGPGANDTGSSRHHLIAAVEGSLRRLGTDYIDLYQCHWVDLDTPIEETLSALDDLVEQGKIRYIGASNYPAWRLMEALATSDKRSVARFDSYQPEYSLMERQLFEYEAMPLCKHYGLGVIPYSPLAGGFLTGKYRKGAGTPESVRAGGNLHNYGNDRGWAVIEALDAIGAEHGKTVAQTALAWMLTNPVITAPIIGANTTAQLTDALGAAGYRLSADEMQRLNELTKWPRNGRPIWD